MLIKGVVTEDFVNYKKPSMFISTATCTFKCDRECGRPVCQNGDLANAESMDVSVEWLSRSYMSNPITKAIVLGGLEPMDQFDDIVQLVHAIRVTNQCRDDIVIYTGYNKDEIREKLWLLSAFPNIIVKYGRYCPGELDHYDEVLGVRLASPNQYAERIS